MISSGITMPKTNYDYHLFWIKKHWLAAPKLVVYREGNRHAAICRVIFCGHNLQPSLAGSFQCASSLLDTAEASRSAAANRKC